MKKIQSTLIVKHCKYFAFRKLQWRERETVFIDFKNVIFIELFNSNFRQKQFNYVKYDDEMGEITEHGKISQNYNEIYNVHIVLVLVRETEGEREKERAFVKHQ